MRYEEVKAVGNYVVLSTEKAEDKTEIKTDSGIILQAETAKINVAGQVINVPGGKMRIKPPKIISVGPKVNLEEMGFKIGDTVYLNEYDARTFASDDKEIFIVCKDINIQCAVKTVE